jgi:ankyrin repeat protein
MAMLTACRAGNLFTAMFLTEKIPLNVRSPLFWTAVLHACCGGNCDIVDWLLNIASIASADRSKLWLAVAAGQGDTRVVGILVNRIGAHDTVAMSQALRIACYRRRIHVVEYLLRYTSADVSRRGDVVQFGDSMTPLVTACHVGQISISTKLLQCVTPHVVKNDMNSTRNTLLHLAIWIHTSSSNALQLHLACTKGQML